MILEEIKNIKSTKPELKKFGLTIGIVLILIGVALLYFQKSGSVYFLAGGAVTILVGITSPIILLPFQKIWMTLAVVLGYIMTRVILALLFYVIFTPMRLIAALFGKKFMDLRFKKDVETYWNKRQTTDYEKIETERQF